MAVLRPFRALRPLPEVAERVASVPYDVVNRQEAARLAEGNRLSFLRVTRAEIELPPDTDPYDPAVYRRAAENLERMIREGHLVEEERPCLYLYRQVMGDHEQTGIAGCFSVEEYEGGRIRKHEHTRKAKEDDRTRHIVATRAQTGVVFLTHRPEPALADLAGRAGRGEPLYDFTAADGVRHTLWRVEETGPWEQAFARLPQLYIADGHHRIASASRARAAFPQAEEAGYVLAVAFPADQVQILAYHRLVRDLGGLAPQEFLERVGERFPVVQDASDRPPGPGRCSMYLEGRWYGLDLRERIPNTGSPAERLDSAVLQEHLLAPLLGIEDVRTDPRIDFVGGIRGTRDLERRVDSGEMAVAFSMHPTSLDQLMAIADAGEVMPPKSTWFEPKLRDGLLVHRIGK